MGLTHYLWCCVLVVYTLAEEAAIPPTIIESAPESLIRQKKLPLTCTATGEPRPAVKWKRLEPSSLEYGANSVIEHDGLYQCIAQNKHGIAMSNYTDLKSSYFGRFIKADTPVIETPDEGSPLELPCTTETSFSVPDPEWKWGTRANMDEEPVEMPTSTSRVAFGQDGTLRFAYVIPADHIDAKLYACGAYNRVTDSSKYGNSYKVNVKPGLKADRTPEISYTNAPTTPNKFKVLEGETLSLNCLFRGYPDITIKWTKEGSSGLPSGSIRKYGNTRLVIPNVANTDQYNGRYTCTGKNTVGEAKQVFDVDVLVKPRFKQLPDMVRNINVTEGDSVVFVCDVVAKPAADITWLKNGVAITPEPRMTFIGNRMELRNATKGDNELMKSDNQVITCKAENKDDDGKRLGTRFISGYINVLAPLKIAEGPKSFVIVDMNDDIELPCKVQSDVTKKNDVTVTWYRDDVQIVTGQEKFEIYDGTSLKIHVNKFDKVDDVLGEFKCIARTTGPFQSVQAACNVTSDGSMTREIIAAQIDLWWIAIVVVVVIIFIIIVLICCCIKRNMGESYRVDEIERKMGNDPEKDLQASGFQEYQRPEKDPMGGSRASLTDLNPIDSEDDHDSLAEYGDMDPGKFTEDGSFIGQYGTDRRPPPYTRQPDTTF